MGWNGEGFATHGVACTLYFFIPKLTDAEERDRSDFLLISSAFLSALVSPFFPRDRLSFFAPPPRLFLRIYLALKQKIGANSRARARLIVHSYRGKLILHHRRTFLLFSFRFASFLHSARSCRQQSDQGWKLGPGGSAP